MATLNSTTKLSQLVLVLPLKRLDSMKWWWWWWEECRSFCLGFPAFWWNGAVLVLIGLEIACIFGFVFLIVEFVMLLLFFVEAVPHIADDSGEFGHLGLGIVLAHIAENIVSVEEVSSECSFGWRRSRSGNYLAGFSGCGWFGNFRHWEWKWYNWERLSKWAYSFTQNEKLITQLLHSNSWYKQIIKYEYQPLSFPPSNTLTIFFDISANLWFLYFSLLSRSNISWLLDLGLR